MDNTSHLAQARMPVINSLVTLSSDPFSFGLMNWAFCIVAAFMVIGFCNNAWFRYGTFVDQRRILSAERRCLLSRVCGCRSECAGDAKRREERRSSAGEKQHQDPAATPSGAAKAAAPTAEAKTAVEPVAPEAADTTSLGEEARATEGPAEDPRRRLPTSMRRRSLVDLKLDFPHTLTEKQTGAAAAKGAPAKEREPVVVPDASDGGEQRIGCQNSSYSWGGATPYSTAIANGVTDIFDDNSSVDSALMTSGPSFAALFGSVAPKTASFSSDPASSGSNSNSNSNSNGNSSANNSRCFPVYTKEVQESMLKKREANAQALREARRALETVESKEQKASGSKA